MTRNTLASRSSFIAIPLILAIAFTLAPCPLRAGEKFKTFIKECGMGNIDINDANSFPWSNPLDSLAANGVNYVRLDMEYLPAPSNSPLETWRDEAHILKMAKLVKAAGLKLEVVITYTNGDTIPSPWYGAYRSAVANNPNFDIADSTVSLQDTIYNYTYRVLSDFKDQGTPVDMITVGNEIGSGFLDFTIPSATPLYYQLLYEGCKAAKDVDSTIGVVIHFRNSGTAQLTDCANLAYARERFGIAHDVPFDAFGFSFLEFKAALDDPNVPSSGPIALKQFLSNPLFVQIGKPLFVQETGWAWTFEPETFNGRTWGLSYTSPTQFKQTGYAFTPSGDRRYLIDEMRIIADSSNGLGIGTCVWAADNVTGWGRHPGMYNFALWDSKTGRLVADRQGKTILSAFKSPFDETLLSSPALLAPAVGDTLQPQDALLVWHSVPGATSYEIQISSQSSFSNIVVDSAGITDTVFCLSKWYSQGPRYLPGPHSLGLNMQYYWRVEAGGAGIYSKQFSFITPSRLTGIATGFNDVPTSFVLEQNYPNPFNPATTIRYQLSADSFVSLKVYDVLGRRVANIVNERQNVGGYSVTFDASRLASGVYFYRLIAGNYSSTKSMLLIK